MAEELKYGSGSETATNKRKYDDQTTPPPSSVSSRRATGFSAPILSQSPDSVNALSYNNVPPPATLRPADAIEMAKQKAQEIAARLLLNPGEVKRPRVENGASGFEQIDNAGQKPMISNVSPSSIPVSYGYQATSKKIDIPNGRVGVIIGRSGDTIKYLQLQSGAKIQVTRDMDADPYSATRAVELMGTADQIAKAEELIHGVLSEAETGGSGIVSRRITGQQPGAEQYVTKIPNNKVGLIIGKGGETIKSMQSRTGARIQVIPLHPPPGDTSTERTLQIDGTSDQIEAAKLLVEEVISENRIRNQGMAGGYTQQGYQARPPANWAPPAPQMQQSGYGYMQSGAYPSPSPQYNISQPPYTGYSPQPTSGGYATGWEQTTGTPNQQTSQGGGYDYYNQQTQPQQTPGGSSAPADNTSYGYSQAPTAGYNPQGQGYPQDAYAGYSAPAPQAGYGQPQPNPTQGYDQQQGYTSAGYGTATNPTPEGNTPSYGGAQADASQVPPPVQPSSMGQQGYNTTQQPTSNPPSYPPPGSTQPGYGVPTSQPGYGTQAQPGYGPNYGPPQAQKPPTSQPAYGQPQQSPSTQGGYVQPAPLQPGYTHSQPVLAQAAYSQPDSGAQRTPPSSYGAATAQPGYAAPPYGPPPVTQPGYGQQMPPYSSSYGSGYTQAPAYSADGNAGGSARGTYDAAPTSQAVQPTTVAKASPKS